MKYLVIIAFLVLLPEVVFGQSFRGTLVDPEGGVIPGAKIEHAATKAKTRSDYNGKFNITVKPWDTLIITAYSFDTMRYTVTEKSLKSIERIVLNYYSQEYEEINITQKRMASFDVGFLPPVKGVRLNSGTNAIIELENLSGAKSTGNPRELFAKIPGINIWENDGAGIQMGIGGRGLSPNRTANFNTRQNGYDISADALGYPESYYTPPIEALKSIEIIRGSAALQFGTQFGGLLNFVIKDPVNYTPLEITTRNTVGGYGYFGTFNRLSGTSNRVSYQVYHQYKRGNGYRENSGFQQHQFFGQVGYAITEKWNVGIEFTKMSYLSQQAGGLTDFMFAENPRQSIRERNWFHVDWNMLAVTSTTALGRNATLDIRAFGMISERQTLGFLGKVTQSDPIGRREMIDSKFKNKGIETRYLQKYSLSEKESRSSINGAFVVGARFYQGETVTNQGTATDGMDADFTFKNPSDLENSSFTYPSLNRSLFAENMLFLGEKIRLNFGIRFEDISSSASGYYKRYSIHPFNFDTLNISTIRDSNTVIRQVPLFGAGLSYKIAKHHQLYTNITQNYRAINFSDIRVNNPNIIIDTAIRDEYGFTAELGWRGLIKEFMIYDVAAFYIFYGDKIGLAPLPGTILRERTNIGDAQNYGLETFLEINWSKAINDSAQHQVSSFINASYINANYINSKEPNFLDKRVEYVSALILKTGLKFHYRQLILQTQFSYNSEQFSDASNAVEPSGDAILGIVPAYYVIDFSGRYQFKKNFSVELGITNLTNNQYFTRRATGYPGPGILPSDGVSFYTTIQYQFKLKNRH